MLVDDDKIFNFLSEKTITSLGLANEVHFAHNGEEALKLLKLYCEGEMSKPDIIFIDIDMPVMNGLCAGQRLKKMMPRVKLIYLTMSLDPDLAAEAFGMGASGYVLKSSAATELTDAIHNASGGRSYITPLITKNMPGTFFQNVKPRKNQEKLTLRQKEVLQLLAEGRSMKEVAEAIILADELNVVNR